jgi:hypothetical protein
MRARDEAVNRNYIGRSRMQQRIEIGCSDKKMYETSQ